MKIIKNINNNFALAEDGNGSTLVIREKGLVMEIYLEM